MVDNVAALLSAHGTMEEPIFVESTQPVIVAISMCMVVAVKEGEKFAKDELKATRLEAMPLAFRCPLGARTRMDDCNCDALDFQWRTPLSSHPVLH